MVKEKLEIKFIVDVPCTMKASVLNTIVLGLDWYKRERGEAISEEKIKVLKEIQGQINYLIQLEEGDSRNE